MRPIKIDNEAYTYLQKKSIAFDEEPNDVFRRIFNLNQVAKTNTLPLKSSNPIRMRRQLKINLHDLISDGVLSAAKSFSLSMVRKGFANIRPLFQGKT